MHRGKRVIIAFAFFLFVVTVSQQAPALKSLFSSESYFDQQLEGEIARLMENPADPAAILSLYRIDDLKFLTAWDGRVEETLEGILARDSAPGELKAHARWFLSRLDIKAGRLQDAEGKLAELGFIKHWMVIGPFDNEGKRGFDAAYAPESEVSPEKEYEGKERPVKWREYPPIARFSYVNLASVFVPDTDVAGYALTFIRSEAEQDVALRFGSDDAVKVWVDDALVYADDGYHSIGFDQASAGVRLHEGWNKLLVKVTQGDGGWGFMMRVTKPDGSPVGGLITSADISEVPVLNGKYTPRDEMEPVEVFDYVKLLRGIAEEQPENAQAQADYGTILSLKHAFDADEKDDLKAFEKALELDPECEDYYLKAAKLYSDKNKSRRAYEKVIELDPENVEAYYHLGQYYNFSGYPKKAFRHFLQAIDRDGSYYMSQVALANLLLKFGRPGDAGKILSDLTWRYKKVAYLTNVVIGMSADTRSDDEILKACADYLEFDYADQGARSRMTGILRKQGRMEDVIGQIRIMYDLNPGSISSLEELAKIYIGLMQFDKAEDALKELLSIRPEDPDALEMLGAIAHWRGENDEAMEQWNESLAVKPQNRDLREYVEFLRPKEKPFEDDYKVDVAELISKFNPSEEDYPEDSSVFLLDQVVYEVHPNGLSNRFVQQAVKILQKKGLEDFKYRYVTYSPGEDQVEIQAAKIYKLDADGNVTKVINADGPFEQQLSNESSKLYYNVMARIHAFNNLEVGDVVEYTFRTNQVGAKNLYADYFGNVNYIEGGLPKKEMRVTYITPASKTYYYNLVRIDEKPEIKEENDKKVFSWTLKDVGKIEGEPHMPGLAEITPYIHISTFKSWEEMGDWYWGLIQDQFELDQESKGVVKELVEGLDTTLAKVKAIHNYVVQNTRYIGLEFGIHGHKPYKAYQVFSRKYGDCKDKATLMVAMLKEAGVDADIVVIRTKMKGQIDTYPASLAVFDHAICYVPELDLFLDGTAEYSGTTELPYNDEGMPVLIVSEKKREFTRTPVDTPEKNVSDDVYNIAMDAEGGVAIDGERNVTGQYCAYYRSRYEEPQTRKEVLEKSWRSTVPTAELLEYEFSDLKDLEKSVSYTYKIDAPKYATKNDDGSMTFAGLFAGYSLTSNYANLSEREYDLEMDFPWIGKKTMKYTLPEGYAIAELPEGFSKETPFATFEMTYEKTDEGLTVSTTFTLKATRITVDQYDDFREFCQLVDEKQNEKIRISK